MTWSLYNNIGEPLSPLKFSNGKTQEDVVKEVLKEIEGGNKIIFIHGVCGTGKCLDKDSLAFCKPEGEYYFRYHKISEIENKDGDIISLNKNGDLIQTKFKNVRKTGKKKLYSIKTKTGREIIVSLNHPFLTITDGGIEWKKLEELNNKSYICLPNEIKLNNFACLEDEKIKVLAHLISEGKLGDKAGSPKYYQDKYINPKIRKDYENALQTLFPDGEIKNEHKTEVTIVFNNMDTRFGTTNKLRLFVREFGLDRKKSKDKFVPEIIFNLNKEKISLFLRTLFSGDGCIYSRFPKNKNEQFIIEYSSISKRLIQDVSLLLNIIGIQHSITSKRFRENKNYCYRISVSNQTQVKKFIELIGFIGEKQETALKILPKLKEHKFTNIDKVPRIIREYMKNMGYSYNKLDRFLNYEEIEELNKNIGFKEIKKITKSPCVFKQSKIDFLREHIRKVNEYINDETISFICNEEIIWDKIKRIGFVKEDETYDIEVPELGNFIANGIIVHNSAIALNIAKEIGKTSIIVPGKNLQAQYKKDYEHNKYLLKENGEKLKISVITGRSNHKCKFIEDNEIVIPKFKKEENSKLNDIFEFSREELEQRKRVDKSAEKYDLPCKIEIKEKNSNKIREYLKNNKRINPNNIGDMRDVKRISIASICPYWSPVIPEKYELKSFEAEKRVYNGLGGQKFIFYQRKPGCKFYEQFNSYLDADIIVFNSLKYKLESGIGRKPLTEIEIIDECDEFLDSFSNQRIINIDRLQNSLNQVWSNEEFVEKVVAELSIIIKNIKHDKKIEAAIYSNMIFPLKETKIYDLLMAFLDNQKFLEDIDDESYLFDVAETARMFDEYLNETFLTFSRRDNNLQISLVTTNLEKKFKEMVDKNKIVVLMSGTLHSEEVLKKIFGLDSYKIIEAETIHPGHIEVVKTGLEMDCKYDNFCNGKNNREGYLKAFSKCLEIAKKPILIHVNSFIDLPSEIELQELKINNIISREKLKEIQREDKTGKMVESFKKGEIDVLFSTKASRGMDFPGEQCNSIVFTKYPNPNVKDAFWKILKQTRPEHYWSFYKDKARRELMQKIYRGLRFKEDHVYLLSPDIRVLNVFEKKSE